MTIYAHVSEKSSIPGQNAYYLELLRVTPLWDGTIQPCNVIQFRYMVAGNMFMRQTKPMDAKQGKWVASYVGSPENAQQMLREWTERDTAVSDQTTTYRVVELTVGLNETDLIQIRDRAAPGVKARFRATHWLDNHIGKLTITDDGRDVDYVGGID